MASPLLLGNDPRSMSQDTLATLLAPEVIAVNQDPLVKQGRKVWDSGAAEVWRKDMNSGAVVLLLLNTGNTMRNITTVFSRDAGSSTLHESCVDKSDSCAFWAENGECKSNPGYMAGNCPVSCRSDPVRYCGATQTEEESPAAVATSMKYILVRDLWARSDVGIFENSYTALDVQPHACRVISIRYVSKQFKSFIEARLGKFKDALSTGMRGSSFEKNIRKRRGKPNTSSLAESENETLGKVHEASMLTDMQSAEQAYSTPDPTSKRVQADEQYRPEPHFSLGMAASALRQNRFGYLLLAENVAILCMIVCNRRVQRCLQLLHSRCLGLSGVTASKADVH
mmetsp:Transcript_33490/g.63024  ORF Transcript_33490/g.63024 Transcript_33490/m.63024 type:complete len:340 (+) Transcript_33490:76-1095(+)